MATGIPQGNKARVSGQGGVFSVFGPQPLCKSMEGVENHEPPRFCIESMYTEEDGS